MTSIITKQDYTNHPGLNFSKLNSMMKDPRSIDPTAPPITTTDAMDLGSLTDCLLLTPNEVDQRFYFSAAEKPGDRMGVLLDNYMASGGPLDLSLTTEEFIQQRREAIGGGWGNWGAAAVLKSFREQCTPYMTTVLNAGERIVVPPSMETDCRTAATSVLTCTAWDLAGIFSGEGEKELTLPHYIIESAPVKCTVSYQMGIAWEYAADATEITQMKSLLDAVVINDSNSIAIIFDLKTVQDNPRDFYKKFILYGYYLQAGLYVKALKNLLTAIGKGNYAVEFAFVVASAKYPPMLWKVTEGQIAVSEFGAVKYDGMPIMGYAELIRQYNTHMRSQQFIYSPKELAEGRTFQLRIL